MQFITMSIAFFAALATAHQHGPQHFHNRRQLKFNSSEAAETGSGAQTTLTVIAEVTHTTAQPVILRLQVR
jgi:hypothetical protein